MKILSVVQTAVLWPPNIDCYKVILSYSNKKVHAHDGMYFSYWTIGGLPFMSDVNHDTIVEFHDAERQLGADPDANGALPFE